MDVYKRLRTLLETEHPLVMPDAYDALSARLIEGAGFKAVQCSGYSMAMACGCKSEVELGLGRNLQMTTEIVRSVGIPVMADGEDGFGGPEAARATFEAFLDAGVAGINIEDQHLGSDQPRQLVERREMVEKIAVGRRIASDRNIADFIINGRTDALAVAGDRRAGIAEAIERSNLYLEAGADLVFVTAAATLDEVKTLVKEISGPVSVAIGLPYNMQTLSIANVADCGVARISLPAVAVFAAINGIKQALASISMDKDFEDLRRSRLLCTREDLVALAQR